MSKSRENRVSSLPKRILSALPPLAAPSGSICPTMTEAMSRLIRLGSSPVRAQSLSMAMSRLRLLLGAFVFGSVKPAPPSGPCIPFR